GPGPTPGRRDPDAERVAGAARRDAEGSADDRRRRVDRRHGIYSRDGLEDIDRTMNSITVTLENQDDRHGRYVATLAGQDGEAELVFTWRGDHLLSADHTFAPENLRGSGAAMALVERLIADARARGFKIIPLCPYVRAKYEEHPDWADVMTVAPGEKPHLKHRAQ